jgi:hypothetical protein
VVQVVRLADDGQVGVLRDQRREQFVYVPADTTTVRGDGGGVDDDAGSIRQEELRTFGGGTG